MHMRMRKMLATLLAAVMVLGLLPGGAAASGSDKKLQTDASGWKLEKAAPGSASQRGMVNTATSDQYVPGEVIVRFKDGTTANQRSATAAKAGARTGRSISRKVPGLVKAELKAGVAVEDAIAAYERDPMVEYAQPNYRKRMLKTPNDPSFTQLWGLNNTGQNGGTVDADIDAPEAWEISTGSSDVVVAVIDSGVDYTHPDLAANMWVNPGEIPGNGIDDDGNGYVDDIHGADTVNNDGDPFDDNDHGTHCAGTIGAKGDDELGVVGVNWNVRIMAIKMLDAEGWGTTESAVKAFEYAQAQGVKLASNSWGGVYSLDQAEYDAIAAFDGLAVFAAGNSSANTDSSPHYPSAYNLPNILAVGATDKNDAKASFSNYGATTVDVFAPGVGIVSTVPAPKIDTAVILDEPFNNLSKWNVFSFNAAKKPWELAGTRYVSPSSAAANIGYVNNQWESLEIKEENALTLAGAEFYKLRGKTWIDLETGYDFIDFWLRSPTHSWQYLASGTGDTGGFIPFELNLSDYPGADTILTFEVVSDESINSAQGWDGVWLDDLQVVAQKRGEDFSEAYEPFNGTSMATPHVSGVAALALAVRPDLTTAQLKQAIMQSVDAKAGLSGLCVTGGRVNANTLLTNLLAEISAGEMHGTVDAGGVPISGATVKAGSHPAVNTATDGSYRVVGLAPGTYSVTVSHPDYYPITYEALEVVAGADLLQNASLAPRPGSVGGKVTSGGAPLSGVSVKVGANPTVTSGADGTYLAGGIAPGTYSVTYTKSGYYPKTVSGVTVEANRAVTRDVSLDRLPGTLSGRVTNGGVGVGSVAVKIGSRAPVYTNSSGYYTATGVPVGSYSVSYSKSGYVTQTLGGVGITAGGTTARNVALARTVVKAKIVRKPTSSKLSYKRKSGVAKFKLSAKVTGWGGLPLAKRTVYLQTSKTGTSGWKNTYKLTTSSTGSASKSFKIKTKGVRYYRWYMPAKSGVNYKAYTTKQKVTVK